MTYYWLIKIKNSGKAGDTYIKTNAKYIPEMIVDIAIRQKMFHESFVRFIESVTEVTEEEFYKHRWD